MQLRVNDQIRVLKVHLIDESGKSFGEVSTDQALLLAYEKGLDLVEVGPHSNPPVARLMDYGKYLYEQHKKQRKAKSHQKESKVKEIKLGFKTEEHDFTVKARRAVEFLQAGHKVRLFMILRGREKAYPRDGIDKLKEFAKSAQAKFEVPPKQLGNAISAILTTDQGR